MQAIAKQFVNPAIPCHPGRQDFSGTGQTLEKKAQAFRRIPCFFLPDETLRSATSMAMR